jgi:outer membrane protein assembly factor BamD
MTVDRHLLLLRLLLAATAVVSTACAAKTHVVEYTVSAQTNYEKGRKEIDRQDWIAAASYFSFVTSKFPWSKYALLAELGLADVQFGAGHYLDALAAYRMFMKLHPTHELVWNGDVSFRAGEAYGRSSSGQ